MVKPYWLPGPVISRHGIDTARPEDSVLRRNHLVIGLVALAVLLLSTGVVEAARKGRPRVKFHPDWAKHPASRYGALSRSACMEELRRRGVPASPVARAPGVLAPVRLDKDVGGILYRTDAPSHLRNETPYDVFDCRLVVALHDWSALLRSFDIDEVRIFSAWRPPPRGWPEGKLSTRHPGALAVDVRRFGKRLEPGQTERKWIDVLNDFHGSLGKDPCGPRAVPPTIATPEAATLRAITCGAAQKHLFTAILTPNYDRAHQNHLHLELFPGATWFLVR